MEQPALHQDTPAWIFFVYTAFVLSLGMMCIGIYHLPVDWWIKGYFAMGLFFSVASALTLSKTLRDNHENKKLVNKVQAVRTEKMISELGL